jgi:branched-chain amino acid transport system ATP-binding protein
MGGSDLLCVEGVAIRYGSDARPVEDLTLRVPDGATVAVVGSNGAGKTTLFRALSGTLGFHDGAVAGGRVVFGGSRVDGLDAAAIVRLGLAHVPEGRRVFTEMTVEENLLAGGMTVRRAVRRAALAEVLGLFPVLGRKRRLGASLLSGGEQQMLAIGRALMSRPRLLLLDEPSLGLAPTMITHVGDLIARIADGGTTVLLAEQNVALAARLASTVHVLRLGRVAFSGTPDELADSTVLRDLYLGAAETREAP